MTDIQFEGQQTDEQILYKIKPHPLSTIIAIITVILLAILFYAILLVISTQTPSGLTQTLRIGGFLFAVLLVICGTLWNKTVYAKSRTYITDRRIMRFEVMTPFMTTKRALFWNEALKAKGFPPNLFYKWLKVGMLEIDAVASGHENVRVPDVYYYDDLASYIDKILFIVKNKATDVATLKPFVPKPKGQRDQQTLTS